MARKTIATSGGNWSDPDTWEEGEVPTAADMVFATRRSGPVTVDVNNATCATLDFGNYIGEFTFAGGSLLTIMFTISFGPGLVFVNPIDTLVFDNPIVSVITDTDAQTIAIDNGSGILNIVPYI